MPQLSFCDLNLKKMKNRYCIALDLDGTLLDSQKKISERNLSALFQAQEEGSRLVIASGRCVQGIQRIADQLKLSQYGGFLLAYNGGILQECSTGKILHEDTLPEEKIPYLYECGQREGLCNVSYIDGQVVTEQPDNPYVKYLSNANGLPIRQVECFLDAIHKPLNKCLIVGEPEKLQVLEVEMKEHLGSEMNVTRSEPFLLELLPPGVDKASCLAELLEYLQFSRDQLVAFGDGFNDRSMISYAGVGVAMGNAQDVVKSVADIIAPTNDESGVAQILEKL